MITHAHSAFQLFSTGSLANKNVYDSQLEHNASYDVLLMMETRINDDRYSAGLFRQPSGCLL